MKAKLCLVLAAVFLISSAALVAGDRPHEGKVIRVDQDMKAIVVQGEKGDQWTLYWTETTKLKDGVTFGELKPGDEIEFEYMDKDGKMWLSEVEREHRAK